MFKAGRFNKQAAQSIPAGSGDYLQWTVDTFSAENYNPDAWPILTTAPYSVQLPCGFEWIEASLVLRFTDEVDGAFDLSLSLGVPGMSAQYGRPLARDLYSARYPQGGFVIPPVLYPNPGRAPRAINAFLENIGGTKAVYFEATLQLKAW